MDNKPNHLREIESKIGRLRIIMQKCQNKIKIHKLYITVSTQLSVNQLEIKRLALMQININLKRDNEQD